MSRSGLTPTLILAIALAAPATAQVPDEFTNLKVLPGEMGKRELTSVMRDFSIALGVRCTHCHVQAEGSDDMNWASDELEHKRVARAMMKMTGEINGKLLPASGRDSLTRVECVTCHRGVTEPEQLVDVLDEVAEKEGVDAALARFSELRGEYYGSGSYDFGPRTLNDLAETVAREMSDLDGAVRIVQRNVELHPESAAAYMTLGQLQLQKGDKSAAIAAIERAIEVEPGNDWAKRMLQRMKASE